jgi:AcrR family transcriptional regulator
MNRMRLEKRRYHHGDLRSALVEEGLRLVEAGGAESFSLREAARNVGVSANAAYRHFVDRSALLAAVAAAGFARLATRMKGAMDAAEVRSTPATAVRRFKAVGRAYVEFALGSPTLFRLMFSAAGVAGVRQGSSDPTAGPTPLALLAEALDALVAAGVLARRGRSGAELKAWAAVHGFASLVLDGARPLPQGATQALELESILDFALTGLTAGVRGGGPGSRGGPRAATGRP